MSDAHLHQFIHVLLWKAGPVLVLSLCGAVVLRELLRRIGRRAVRVLHEARPNRETVKAPHCPSCERPMVRRTVRRGTRAGADFWGCSNYPACTDTRGI